MVLSKIVVPMIKPRRSVALISYGMLGGGPMWEPMAIAIMFGLLFATALTLGLVPVLYSIFFRVGFADFKY